MLFDLRGRGRRRTVQVIYLSLAILMGGGLVLFGIGGARRGGLLDAITGQQRQRAAPTPSASALEGGAEARPRRNRRTPRPGPARQAALPAGGHRRRATTRPRAPSPPRARSPAARRARRGTATSRSTRTSPTRPSPTYMVQAFAPGALNKSDKAVRALEVVIDGDARSRRTTSTATSRSTRMRRARSRKGDLAADKARRLAPKNQRSLAQAADRRPEDRGDQAADPRRARPASRPRATAVRAAIAILRRPRPCSSTGRAADS